MKRAHLFLSTLLCILLVAPGWPAAAESWTSIRTRNLFLISNAAAAELRQVAAWLELFHDTFSRLTSKPVFDSSIPTVGIIFRSDKDFEPFKPLYQGKPAELAGYFQQGNDVNYIAISLEPGGRDPLNAAFHEYVHLYVRTHIPQAPLWLNEGLAEFYSTFEMVNGAAVIGAPIDSYIYLLRNSESLPLVSLFSVNQASAHYNDRDKRGIFYAESWALVHFLMLANNGQRQAQLRQYLSLLAAGVSVESSFKMAFQTTFEALEKELNEYIRRDSFPTQRANVGSREDYGTATEALSRAEADYYLGDLLLHIGRQADAERYFVEALSLDPNLVLAHAALGMLRVRQNRLAEALRHLERAAPKSRNHLVHFFYAYMLTRQGMTEDGSVATYAPEALRTIRTHLQTTISLAPDFAEAYHLLAFTNLVANDQLDQSVDLIKRAISLEPGRQGFKLVLAQIYLKQRDQESARRILESLARQSDDKQLRAQAESLLANSSGNKDLVPRVSTAAPTTLVSVRPSVDAGAEGMSAGGMRIDTSGPLPELNQILAKYVAVLGGQEKIRKLKSRVTRGTARMPGQYSSGPFETYEQSPNKAVTAVRVERLGVFVQGFDGTIGWRQAPPSGMRRLSGIELAELQRDCDFYAPLRLNVNYAEVKLLGKVKIGYREAYLVEAKPAVGDPDKLYFEDASGLLIRWDGVRSDWRGRGLVEVYFDDWREVDGIKLPFRVSRSSPHFTIVFTVKEVKHDIVIDELMFAPGGVK